MSQSYVRVGSGIPKRPADSSVEAEDAQEVVDVVEAPVEGSSVWSDTPTFSDQLFKYPLYCRLGPVITKVFVLAVDTELNALNTLMTRTIPEAAPGIVVLPGGSLQWSEALGSYVELVKYREVSYKRLIKRT